MAFRFIHAADIHLDSPLTGLSAYENAPAEQLRGASREALRALIDKAIDERVAFIVIAGDLYDGKWKDYNTGLFFAAQMGRLDRAGIRAFVLHGNHDAESEMTRRLVLPANVSVFPAKAPHVFRIDDLKVALHGQSFATVAVEQNLAAGYGAALDDHFNIGVLHTALEGYAAHASYAPCRVDELHARGYDYWALGHVHEFQRWDGPSTIVFPGNLQGRNVRETGRKGAVLVSVDDGGRIEVERLFIDILRWEVLRVDIGDCADLDDIARAVGDGLRALLRDDDVPRAVRVRLEGRTRLHGALFGRAEDLRAQVLAQAVAIDADQLWIEKLRIGTTPLATGGAGHESAEAFETLRAIVDEATEDPAFLDELHDQLRPFLNKVTADTGDDAPLFALARERRFADLVREVAPELLARLSARPQ